MIIRLLLCIALVVCAVVLPVWLFAIAAFAYALYYTAYELLLITALLDAFYGGGIFIPYYTIACAVVLIMLEWVKPRLSVYNENP